MSLQNIISENQDIHVWSYDNVQNGLISTILPLDMNINVYASPLEAFEVKF
jgi:hypothetical protein